MVLRSKRRNQGRWEASRWCPNAKLNELDYRGQGLRTQPRQLPIGLLVIAAKRRPLLRKVPDRHRRGGGRMETKESSSNETTEKGNEMSAAVKNLMDDCAAIGQAINKAKKAGLDPYPDLTFQTYDLL